MSTQTADYEFGSLVGGREDKSGQWVDVFNPYHGGLVGRVSAIDAAATAAVIERTRAAKAALSRFERARILNAVADALLARIDEASLLITSESGLCLADTAYEVRRAVDVLRFSAMRALEDDSEVFPCDVSAQGRPRRIYTMREPLNLIAAITPFNHPLNQVVHKIAPAIATNNTVVLKPSRRTPLAAFYFARLCHECGLPPDMLNVVCGSDTEVAETLVAHEAVELVTFTGGSAVGRRIAERAGYKRCILELGGSSAMLVLADADPEEAAAIAAAGTFKNSGQRCTAIRRLLVHESLAEAFGEALAAKAEAVACGDPFDPATEMGTVITEAAAIEMEGRVEAALRRGAVLLAGHRRRGALYPPTVLDHVRNDDELVAQETFGPVAPIIRFGSLDEAIAIANDTAYGLSGAVVSNHWPSIQRAITELETGTVNVNIEPSYRLEWSPFGGFKASGLGEKEGVIEAMKGMTRVKTYSLPWDRP